MVGTAAWVAFKYQSREVVMVLAFTLCTSLLDAVRQLRLTTKDTPSRHKLWRVIVVVTALGSAAIGLAIAFPLAAASISVGVEALILAGAAFRRGW